MSTLQLKLDPVKELARRVESLRALGYLQHVKDICVREHATLEDVLGPSQRWRVVRVRHLVWWELNDLRLSYTEIGEIFGRDRGGVRAGIVRARELLGLVVAPRRAA